MCLGIPGRVTEWTNADPLFATAMVEFGGVAREVHMACVLDASVDDYVVVHAGIAICIVNAEEAEKTLADLERLGEIGNELGSELDGEISL